MRWLELQVPPVPTLAFLLGFGLQINLVPGW